MLDQSLGLLNHHFCNLHVPGRGLVKGGRNHLALDGALHIGDFFRALVNEQNDQHHFRMVGGDRVGHVLQQHGLAGAWRRDDQAALPFANRSQQVHHSGADILARGFEFQTLLRI